MTVFQTRPVDRQPHSRSFPARPYIAVSTVRPVDDFERSMVADPADPRPDRSWIVPVLLVLVSAVAWGFFIKEVWR